LNAESFDFLSNQLIEARNWCLEMVGCFFQCALRWIPTVGQSLLPISAVTFARISFTKKKRENKEKSGGKQNQKSS